MASGIVLLLAVFSGINRIYAGPALTTYPEHFQNGIVSRLEPVPRQLLPFQMLLRVVSAVGTVTGCEGSIIHENWVLTAAHCTANRITILGRAVTRSGYIVETDDYWNHPLYNEEMQDTVQENDISIIWFNKILGINEYVQPIRMQRSADKNRDYSEVRLIASGYSPTELPESLNWMYVFGTSTEFCRHLFRGSSVIQDTTICARIRNKYQSFCQIGSGGSLTAVDFDGEQTLVGVLSFVSSTGCDDILPGGFVRPGHYHDWFHDVTGHSFDWGNEEVEEYVDYGEYDKKLEELQKIYGDYKDGETDDVDDQEVESDDDDYDELRKFFEEMLESTEEDETESGEFESNIKIQKELSIAVIVKQVFKISYDN